MNQMRKTIFKLQRPLTGYECRYFRRSGVDFLGVKRGRAVCSDQHNYYAEHSANVDVALRDKYQRLI